MDHEAYSSLKLRLADIKIVFRSLFAALATVLLAVHNKIYYCGGQSLTECFSLNFGFVDTLDSVTEMIILNTSLFFGPIVQEWIPYFSTKNKEKPKFELSQQKIKTILIVISESGNRNPSGTRDQYFGYFTRIFRKITIPGHN